MRYVENFMLAGGAALVAAALSTAGTMFVLVALECVK